MEKRKKTYTGHFTFFSFFMFFKPNIVDTLRKEKFFNRAKNEAQLKCMMKGNW